jgi:hypothetical protein
MKKFYREEASRILTGARILSMSSVGTGKIRAQPVMGKKLTRMNTGEIGTGQGF